MTTDRKEQLQYLLAQYIEGKASQKEQELLFRFLDEEHDDGQWEELIEEMMMAEPEEEKYKHVDWQPEIDNILDRHPSGEERLISQKVGSVRKVFFVRMAVAAAILLVLSLSAIFFLGKDYKTRSGGVEQKSSEALVGNDIGPGGDKAVLMLADGRKIVLDTVANGAVAEQGDIKVIKVGGQVRYNPKGSLPQEVLYNTILTPKGGQYQLELADGSKIWLNAASSIRFPTAFVGKERTVELSGEAYFEVAHDAQMPFHVKVKDVDVQVLGTHFNINAYDDEEAMRTTLLQGRVKVTKGTNFLLLNPGQQAATKPSSEAISIINNVEVDDVVAWKEGLFNFEHSDINKILREFARWYDVDIQMMGKPNEKQKFFGIVNRQTSLASALKVLKNAGAGFDYNIEGKKLIVQPFNKN